MKLDALKRERIILEEELKRLEQVKKRLAANKIEIQKAKKEKYCSYFDNKKNKAIKLLRDIPSINDYNENQRFGKDHPLYEFSNYNVYYLMEMLKKVYEAHREGGYDAILFGHINEEGGNDYAFEWTNYVPELYMLIGKEKFIKKYKHLDQSFLQKDISNLIFDFPRYKGVKDCLLIPINKPDIMKKQEEIRDRLTINVDYFNKEHRFEHHEHFSLNQYTIAKNINSFNKIKTGLSFELSPKDFFIRNFLFSLSYYRKNNDLSRVLTKEELSNLFTSLYGETINLEEKDRTLKRVKN